MTRLAACLLASLLLVGIHVASVPAGADHVNPDEIIPVIPKDGIPAILSPTFNDDPSWYPDDWLVIGVDLGGDPRAYPISVLNWHEIVNDDIGGIPVAVTYCPLCRTGIVYDRSVGAQVLSFGVSGKLYKNDLVMYDHQTESYWTQVLGEAIQGTYHGTRLRPFSSITISWGDWKAAHPDSKLLDRPRSLNGGFMRNYLQNPYAGYDTSEYTLYPPTTRDPLGILHPKELVLGVFIETEARAYPITVMRDRLVVNDVVGGQPIVVTYANEAMKAWERGNRNFTALAGTAMRDDDGRTYDRLTGIGPDGALREVSSVTAFWFAWYDFYPATTVFGLSEYNRPASVGSPLLLIAAGLGGAAAAGVAAFVVYRIRKARERPRSRREEARGRRT